MKIPATFVVIEFVMIVMMMKKTHSSDLVKIAVKNCVRNVESIAYVVNVIRFTYCSVCAKDDGVDAATYCESDICVKESLCLGCRVTEEHDDCWGCQNLLYPKLLGEKGVLAEENGRLAEENSELQKEIARLRKENEELRKKA